MPRVQSGVRYVDDIKGSGREVFRLACEHDLEGIAGKWKFGTYRADGAQTSWVKIKNPDYSQAEGRHELFEKRPERRAAMEASQARNGAGVTALSASAATMPPCSRVQTCTRSRRTCPFRLMTERVTTFRDRTYRRSP